MKTVRNFLSNQKKKRMKERKEQPNQSTPRPKSIHSQSIQTVKFFSLLNFLKKKKSSF